MKPFTSTYTALIVTLSSLISSALAVPVGSRADNSTVPWRVSNFTNECTSSTCTYFLNVDFAGTDAETAFSSTCTGNTFGSRFQPCADPSVQALYLPGETDFIFGLSHDYQLNGIGRQVLGNTTQQVDKAPPYAFDFFPTVGHA